MDEGKRKSVAEMVSKYSSKNDSSPTVGKKQHITFPALKEREEIQLKEKQVDDKSPVKEGGGKVGQSNSTFIENLDKSSPRINRTLDYFNVSSPVRKSDRSISVTTTSEKHFGGVFYRRTSVTSGSGSNTSLPASPSSTSPVVSCAGVGKPRGSTNRLNATPPSTAVKRSHSFTSRVSVDFSPKVVKRSSVVFNVSSDESDDNETSPAPKVKLPPPKTLPKPTKKQSNCSSPPKQPTSSNLSVKERASMFSTLNSPNNVKKNTSMPHSVTTPPQRSPTSRSTVSKRSQSVSNITEQNKLPNDISNTQSSPKSRITLQKTESPLFVPVKPSTDKSIKSMVAMFDHSSTDTIPILQQKARHVSISSESSDDEDRPATPKARVRILSVGDDNAEQHINVEVFESVDVVSDKRDSSTEEGFLPKETSVDVPLSDDLHSSPIYSYQQYTLQHKLSRTGTLPSTGTDASTLSLEIIPENEPSHSNTHSTTSLGLTVDKATNSSSDSEQELVRKMSSVSLSFYHEVLETINSTIGPPTEQVEDQSEHINQVVDEIIRNTQRKSSDSENLYETIEEYSRKVSDFVIRQRQRERKGIEEEDVPPELPPRPVYLLKPYKEPSFDNGLVSILESSPNEIPALKQQTVKTKSPEREIEENLNVMTVSRSDRQGAVKKRKKYRSLFKSKVEPRSLDIPPDFTDNTYNPHLVSNERNTIEPTNTSESESEVALLDNRSEASSITGSQSPIKVKWRDEGVSRPPHDDLPTTTPDSGVYLHNGRYLRNPLTPPLVTKLGVMSHTTRTLRFSNSDPSLHLSLLSSPRRPYHVPESPSFSHISMESDTPSLSSFESGKYISEQHLRSPLMRKRVKSDASSDRPLNSSGAIQKSHLLNAALRRRRGSLPGNTSECDSIIEVPLVHADVLMERSSSDPDDLSFTVSDVVAVLDMTDDDWWQGMVDNKIGWFPASWVRLRIGQEDVTSVGTNEEDAVFSAQQLEESHTVELKETTPPNDVGVVQDTCPQEPIVFQQKRKLSRRMTITKRSTSDFPRRLTSIEIRAKCIEEILTTEKEYVQHLKDIVEGFLNPCVQHDKLFTTDMIEAIFSNIREIFQFQQEFLSQLSDCILDENLQDSQIGHLFVQMGDEFCIYSEYCNNHPNAVNEMNLLQEDPRYTYFFESCRLLRNLTDISLEGFLLTPVQRICRYPLQLSELIKHTPNDHPDYTYVLNALDAMRRVAMVINERKRRMEGISKVSVWQETVENWKGCNVLSRSTLLIHSGELHKISRGHSQERIFFLFDHQMVYCKKDAIGGKLSYKGRVDMDKCDIIDIKDGEFTHSGTGIRNAWKMNNADKDDKVYILYAKSAHTKQQWMNAFMNERQTVREDYQKGGFVLTPQVKKAAIAIGLATANGTVRRRSMSKKSHVIIDTSVSSATVDVVGVAQLKTVDRHGNTSKSISSPNELRKRFMSGKKKL